MADDIDRIEDRAARRLDVGGDAFAAECFHKKKEPPTARVAVDRLDVWMAIGGWKDVRRDGGHAFLEWTGEGDPVRPRRP